MSKLFAVVITETVTRKTVVYVSAPEKDLAWDAAQDFAKANDLEHRYQPTAREISAYLSDVNEVAGAGIKVDVEL